MGALTDSLRALNAAGFRPAAAAPLSRSLPAVANALAVAVRDEVPAYAESGNPDVLPGLDRHAADLLAEAHRLLGGSDLPQ
ncbi:MAG: hypothetical protein V2I25_07450, partial [Woeseiaceae bacterium]|nr:hypothetical protein [Woeseiaceae bacterium]